ncbi:porin [Silvimonas soli]|uniref:porin n=1 Tax=Silvimonas soli TaxID=2980100 RepID=UPI0024B35709|nr:porin [Silvimonas soli]
MRLSKLAMTIALTCAAGTSLADVTIYGIAQASIDYGTSGNNSGNRLYYQDIGARLGFKGSDKLDNGSTLEWNLYQYTGGYTWGSREAWIGISDKDWGSFRSGKSKSTYSQVMDDFDLFESNTTLVSTFKDGTYRSFPNSTLFYTSPKWEGLVLKGEYQLRDGSNDNAYGYTVSAKYAQEKFALYGAYQKFGNSGRDLSDVTNAGAWYNPTGAEGKSMQSYLLGAQIYPVPGMIFGALYQHAQQDLAGAPASAPTATQMKRDSVLLMAQDSIGKWTPRVGYVHQFAGKFDNGPSLRTADQFEIGTDYNLSKHSLLYTEASYIKNRGQNGFQSSAADMGWTASSAGDSKVLSVGLIALF